MSITVVVVPPVGPAETHELDQDCLLQNLQELVGGYIESISGPGWVAYLNENGKLDGLPANDRATRVISALGYFWDRTSRSALWCSWVRQMRRASMCRCRLLFAI